MKLQEITRLAPSNYVKIWDYMAVTDLQDFLQIFAEVIKETQIIAEYGTIYDAHGNILKQYAHGLPGRLVFSMTASSPWFELELPNQPRIRQIVTIPKHLLGG